MSLLSFGSEAGALLPVDGIVQFQQGSDDVSLLGNVVADPGSSTAPGAGMRHEAIRSSERSGATRGSSFSSTGSSTTTPNAEDSVPSAGENGGSVDDNASDAGDDVASDGENVDSVDSSTSTNIFDDSPPPNEKDELTSSPDESSGKEEQDDDDLAPGSWEAASPTAEHPPLPSEESVSLIQQDAESQDNERSSSGESERSPAPSQESEGSNASPPPKVKDGPEIIDLTSSPDESSGKEDLDDDDYNFAPPSPSEASSVAALSHPDDESQDNEWSSSGEAERLPAPLPSRESEGSDDASTGQSVSLHEDDAPYIGRASGINDTRRPPSSRPRRTPDHFKP